jgi:hypothetical protein
MSKADKIIKEIENLPNCFCNDGEYTDKEMIDCLLGVIKGERERVINIIKKHLK